MVLNSVMVNCELYRRNYDFEQFSLQYHWTAVDAVVRQLPIASVALLLWSVITETISVTAWEREYLLSHINTDCRDCCVSANTSHYRIYLLS